MACFDDDIDGKYTFLMVNTVDNTEYIMGTFGEK
jgi:hypothetical protein